jgi:hypothetical protein
MSGFILYKKLDDLSIRFNQTFTYNLAVHQTRYPLVQIPAR